MNDVTPLPVTGTDDGGDKARGLITAASALLPAEVPADFAEQLFGRTAPEDLLAYSARDLATLAQDAWGFLAERKPGSAKIRLQSPRDGDRLGAISVIEVVNDDKPFLLDSTMGELTALGLEVRLVAHPVLGVSRDPLGRVIALVPGGGRESFIHIHIERIDDEARKSRILGALSDTLTEVQFAVADWPSMLRRVREVVAELQASPPPLPADEVAEAIEFLQWLLVDNFTFLGVREDTYDAAAGRLALKPGSELGILRHRASEVMTEGGELLELPAAARDMLEEPQALIINKTSQQARVHRRVTKKSETTGIALPSRGSRPVCRTLTPSTIRMSGVSTSIHWFGTMS